MKFVSLWGGDIRPEDVPAHLMKLYHSVGLSNTEGEPGVCAERERVPVEELLEPFNLGEDALSEAASAAKKKSLRLATTVVGIYSGTPLDEQTLEPPGCGFRFLGSFKMDENQ
jgi:hypothetical protein